MITFGKLIALKLKFNPGMRCYQCDIPLKEYNVKPGEQCSADAFTPDHVPPKGLFLKPIPDNLIEVPCCFECNNKHSGFDERLRIVASMPFDRNEVGQRILDEKVIGSTFARERQMQFLEKLATSMQAVPERPELIRARFDDQELKDGMIRITKGLLFALHPTFDYHKSTFTALSISQHSSDKQRDLMTQLMRGLFLERGQGVFQCWRHLDEARAGGVWMLILYGCFGYFVFHTNKPELHTLFGTDDRVKQAQGIENVTRRADLEKLMTPYEIAAAQCNLGDCYEKGRGVPKDYLEAVKWYRKSAAQNLAVAQCSLGDCYANGWGVPKDYAEAYKWYNLASAQGYRDATTERDALAAMMTPEQIAEAQRLSREFQMHK